MYLGFGTLLLTENMIIFKTDWNSKIIIRKKAIGEKSRPNVLKISVKPPN